MKLTLALSEVDRKHTALVGGKAANLGELAQIAGILVPPGFCVTTGAYAAHIECSPRIRAALDLLERETNGAGSTDAALCAEIRSLIEQMTISEALRAAIEERVVAEGRGAAWAVRSSATAEDMPTASFAGQHASYLNLIGVDAVVDAVRRCWASLFTERAVAYRQRNDIGQRSTSMAVIVQRMVPAQSAGVMFTADPVSGDRTVVAIEACAGSGEALVSGAIDAEAFKLRYGEIFEGAGRVSPLLNDEQVRALAEIGRRIEAHFASPQDIEWCLLNGAFQIVQSRPITTLFPIPRRENVNERYVYLSVGHQQMMTDAMKPLGLSFWQMLAARPMYEAGGRLFVDITGQLASPASRSALLHMLSREPLISSAVNTLLERRFIATLPAQESACSASARSLGRKTDNASSAQSPDPAIVGQLIGEHEMAVAEARRSLAQKSGNVLFDFIADDLAALKRLLTAPQSTLALMTGFEAMWWLNDHLTEWLGENGIADILSQSVDNNVTSRMGLDLLDVADAIRPHPAAVSFLRQFDADGSLSELAQVEGGSEALDAITGNLEKYGMRCAGEIDVTRTRWREQPAILVPMIIANVDRFEPGEAERRFNRGLARAEAAEQDVLMRLRLLPDGAIKAAQTKDAIDRLRAFIGYREYPKYGWVSRMDLHKQAMLREAAQLVRDGVIVRADDIFFLRFEELREVVRTQQADQDTILARRAEFAAYERLAPPRVLTSDGEGLFGDFKRDDLPANAIPGVAVSVGIVEGRARIVHDMAAAAIEPGDILVTTYTDPSWTPLFLTVAGLVTEVGGQMSHGAVIAREYGLPAIVAVRDATLRIQDGQRIRLDGTTGFVTLFPTDRLAPEREPRA